MSYLLHKTPFNVDQIPGNFQFGKAVRIRGAIGDKCDGNFTVNFQSDPEGKEIAYHFNARPGTKKVVRNSKSGSGEWGVEETKIPHFPFHHGHFFDLFILATEEGFVTHVNGEFFTLFAHRFEVQKVSHIGISGDVEITDYQYFDQTKDDIFTNIPSGLKNGDSVIVKGAFRPKGDRFAVNLYHEANTKSDIAFHFNPRRGDDKLILNSRYGDKWGGEVQQAQPAVFKENKPFEIRLLIEKDNIKIFCNGKHLSDFAARNPILDVVKAINLAGDAYTHQIKLHREVMLPFTDKFPGLVTDKNWIRFSGKVKKGSPGFEVNLTCGPGDGDDIALHFNTRMKEGEVVRNSQEKGKWQKEEKEHEGFPFNYTDVFEIILHIKSDYIQSYVNGRKFITFKHRLPRDRITHVRVKGEANFFYPDFF